MTESVLDARYTHINREPLGEGLEQIDHIARECRSDITNCKYANKGKKEVERDEEDFFFSEPEYRWLQLFRTSFCEFVEMFHRPLCCFMEEVSTEKRSEKKDSEIFCHDDYQYHTEN